ncbi:DUF1415 domain-containing protein [Leptospira ilyithenensis]|uniref:DUF1415 domain-containing protein n=1 Tax=Leptospira ilyithenensis TaxID=2484901 RepID=A0A4V3JX65_9LEPT|nr:DUF1415 domain-containing protein [Leptospira ilyithenensis]TGN10391.1 DUF1415 domain-containing protein [Leptospira ilyithenensis]
MNPDSRTDFSNNDDPIIDLTKTWLEKAVIGLNLCPFAKSVYNANLIRFVVSRADSKQNLTVDLKQELKELSEADPKQTETTLLIHPYALLNFLDYNDFLGVADKIIIQLKLEGFLQIASFHPDYQFAGRKADDITNFVNRSPYPMLHLLREDSVERANDNHPDIDSIYQNNIDTLRKLGHDGWNGLGLKNPAYPDSNLPSPD